MEYWADIVDYEGYYKVSSHGRVKALARTIPHATKGQQRLKERILKPSLRSGYPFVTLARDNKKENSHIHRLCAFAYLSLIEGKDIVNHKDGNRQNNFIENLEWCTPKENVQHMFSVLGRHGNRLGSSGKGNAVNIPILQLSLTGDVVARYCSAKEAYRNTGVSAQSIGKVALGKRTKAGNFKWQYA